MARTGKLALPTRDQLVDGRSLWWVRMRVEEEDHALIQLGLVPVDRKMGAGPAQARPLWDSEGGCVVASDGVEPLLVHASLGSGRQDTMEVPLPDRADRAEYYEERMEGLLPPGTRLEKPSAAARVQDLIIDPDGFVWLLPVQPRESIPGGVEVVRVPLDGGPAVRDTVRAFPRAFGEPGVFYSGVHGSDGEILVVRYQRIGMGEVPR